MIICKCGEKFKDFRDFNIHIQLRKPSVPPQTSRLLPWLTEEKATKLKNEYDKEISIFQNKHGKEIYD
jgi:hypothetical protein